MIKVSTVRIVLSVGVLAASAPTSSGDAPFGAQQVAAEGNAAVVHITQLADADLKAFYLRCSRAAMRGMLGSGETALCSVGYETLLKRTFAGDFTALLAWRRSQHRAPVDPPGDAQPSGSSSYP